MNWADLDSDDSDGDASGEENVDTGLWGTFQKRDAAAREYEVCLRIMGSVAVIRLTPKL